MIKKEGYIILKERACEGYTYRILSTKAVIDINKNYVTVCGEDNSWYCISRSCYFEDFNRALEEAQIKVQEV